MDELTKFWNHHNLPISCAVFAAGAFGSLLLSRANCKRWCAVIGLSTMAFLFAVFLDEHFRPVQATFEPNNSLEQMGDHEDKNHDGDTRNPEVRALNRARLAGRWVGHPDGSYGWETHAVELTIPRAGGKLINAGPERWTFVPDP